MTEDLRFDSGQIEVMDDTMTEVLRSKTPTERIRIGLSLCVSSRKILTAHLKKIHPEWNDERLNRKAAAGG
jgi:hypothetical protein